MSNPWQERLVRRMNARTENLVDGKGKKIIFKLAGGSENTLRFDVPESRLREELEYCAKRFLSGGFKLDLSTMTARGSDGEASIFVR